jgi:hypothetical protein
MQYPSTGTFALMAIGTPANGRSSPGSIVSAAASARSASTSTNALIGPSRASIRSIAAPTVSRADSSPPRTSAASSPAGLIIRSGADKGNPGESGGASLWVLRGAG